MKEVKYNEQNKHKSRVGQQMSVTVINPSGSQNYQAILSSERFQEFAAKVKEKTGREHVLELNMDAECISWMHPESTQRLGFFVDFFRVGITFNNMRNIMSFPQTVRGPISGLPSSLPGNSGNMMGQILFGAATFAHNAGPQAQAQTNSLGSVNAIFGRVSAVSTNREVIQVSSFRANPNDNRTRSLVRELESVLRRSRRDLASVGISMGTSNPMRHVSPSVTRLPGLNNALEIIASGGSNAANANAFAAYFMQESFGSLFDTRSDSNVNYWRISPAVV